MKGSNKKISQIAKVHSGAATRYFHKTEGDGSPIDTIATDSLSRDGVLRPIITQRWVDPTFPDKFLLKDGDILVQMRGVDFKASVVRNLERPTSVNSNIAIMRLKEGIHPEVVCFYLNSKLFRETVIKKVRSSTILINVSDLKEVVVSIGNEQDTLKTLYFSHLELTSKIERLLSAQQELTEAKFFDSYSLEYFK